jgi:hypothetical protein
MSTIVIDQVTMMSEIAQLISEGHSVTITAKGYSMNPFIVHLKDEVTLGAWEDEMIKKGAVVLVKDSRGSFVLHRIIRRDGDHITLMGDGNLNITENAHIKDMIGIMKSVTKKGRTYQTEGLTWRLYSWLWMALTPLRRWPLGLWRRLYPQQPLR